MKIEVVATAQQVVEEQVEGKTVVVIDVLRATSVMVTALCNGASRVIPVLSPEEAFELSNEIEEDIILGGERHAEPIEGFDYGNSPLSYTPDVIEGKVLIMTTTNGTLAIKNALAAKELMVASFINDKAIAQYLSAKEEVVIVCSGNNGLYTLEDALCAGRIITLIKQLERNVHLCDLALSLEQLYFLNSDHLLEFAAKGHHYNVLKKKGYEKDLQYCFRSGVTDVIPMWDGNALKNNSRL